MSRGLFSRARRRLRQAVESLRSRLLWMQFFLSGWWSGGEIAAGRWLRVHHKTLFQGDGSLRVGANVTFGYELAGFLGLPIILQARTKSAEIVIGDGTAIMNGCFFCACEEINIGANCRIGSACIVVDSDFHGVSPGERDTPGKTAAVIVGDNVWLGFSVTVLKGVRVGKDAIAGAQTVIVKDVPEGAIVVGNPMRIVGSVYNLPPDSQSRSS
jgi:acetyltransferase-like isoleucine patch superfamily enzyme